MVRGAVRHETVNALREAGITPEQVRHAQEDHPVFRLRHLDAGGWVLEDSTHVIAALGEWNYR